MLYAHIKMSKILKCRLIKIKLLYYFKINSELKFPVTENH